MQGSVSSPCVSICALDEEDICVGCHRSADEIREWLLMDDPQRLEVLNRCAERAKKHNPFA